MGQSKQFVENMDATENFFPMLMLVADGEENFPSTFGGDNGCGMRVKRPK